MSSGAPPPGARGVQSDRAGRRVRAVGRVQTVEHGCLQVDEIVVGGDVVRSSHDGNGTLRFGGGRRCRW
jgi:hypothetical protein